MIPNEIFLEANDSTRNIYLNMINRVNEELVIPQQWQEGKIIRLYKGKGTMGMCSNERGITLGSNIGKVVERIYNERVKKKVNMSDYQAGGKKGSATTDHLF